MHASVMVHVDNGQIGDLFTCRHCPGQIIGTVILFTTFRNCFGINDVLICAGMDCASDIGMLSSIQLQK